MLGAIKTDPGRVSPATMLGEIDKLQATRAVGLPSGLLLISPRVSGQLTYGRPGRRPNPRVTCAAIRRRLA